MGNGRSNENETGLQIMKGIMTQTIMPKMSESYYYYVYYGEYSFDANMGDDFNS